ncbi:MAG: dipicolinate synthase subunit B [Clostridia bacterium]|nr:dipicolinate synthase subunit B [Clostridia bacterium]
MNKTVGFAMCGSFCTLSKAIEQMANLRKLNYDVLPIMSEIVWSTDTRFGKSADFIKQAEELCGHKVIHTINDAEPIGPKKLLDALVIAPCTGNTLGKLAHGITDTAVTMAAKSHLRNNRPLIINVSTNDGLGGAAKNIGHLMNYKNIYFVPLRQDDSEKKPRSVVADFTKIPACVESALNGIQLQPMLI